MSDRVTRFLGGSPLSVLVRLVLLSIAVGLLLSWFDLDPRSLLIAVRDFARWLWSSLFGSLDRLTDYFLLGAAIVVPLFLLSRLVRAGR